MLTSMTNSILDHLFLSNILEIARVVTPKEIKDRIKQLSKKGWEDNLVTITAKLILRD